MTTLQLRIVTEEIGAVSVACIELASVLSRALGELVSVELGRRADVIDLRILDGGGREVGPADAVVVAGFRLVSEDGR